MKLIRNVFITQIILFIIGWILIGFGKSGSEQLIIVFYPIAVSIVLIPQLLVTVIVGYFLEYILKKKA